MVTAPAYGSRNSAWNKKQLLLHIIVQTLVSFHPISLTHDMEKHYSSSLFFMHTAVTCITMENNVNVTVKFRFWLTIRPIILDIEVREWNLGF
jgi:tRNA(Phe) wybutosine-synthesizing methylase Tyw3